MSKNIDFLEAQVLLLEGKQDEALVALENSWRNFENYWSHWNDPVILAHVDEDTLQPLRDWYRDHLNAERAKLGWPPADF